MTALHTPVLDPPMVEVSAVRVSGDDLTARPAGLAWRAKAIIEPVIAAGLLLIALPLLLAIAAAVAGSSPGPVLFRQRRLTQGGRPFTMFKFRTMREPIGAPAPWGGPGLGLAPGGVEGEDRRTRVGIWLRRSALDELPQLINVLRGEMSLIGPRPERPEFAAAFLTTVAGYGDRHLIKPGITGLAQVHGLRGATSLARRVELDRVYIQRWSPRLDLRIALMTVAVLLRGEGI